MSTPVKTPYNSVNTRRVAPVTSLAQYQNAVASWVTNTFGSNIREQPQERVLRCLEEAIELLQSVGGKPEQAHALVDYVFGRPPGEPAQEVAGVLVTLLAAAASLDLNAEECLSKEVSRIHQPEVVEKCRRRQAEKTASGVVGEDNRVEIAAARVLEEHAPLLAALAK